MLSDTFMQLPSMFSPLGLHPTFHSDFSRQIMKVIEVEVRKINVLFSSILKKVEQITSISKIGPKFQMQLHTDLRSFDFFDMVNQFI